MKLWHKNEGKHSLRDSPNNEFTLRAPSKYASGHISAVDTSEQQKISGLKYFCQMLQDTTQEDYKYFFCSPAYTTSI